jgi:hypothetical protein
VNGEIHKISSQIFMSMRGRFSQKYFVREISDQPKADNDQKRFKANEVIHSIKGKPRLGKFADVHRRGSVCFFGTIGRPLKTKEVSFLTPLLPAATFGAGQAVVL